MKGGEGERVEGEGEGREEEEEGEVGAEDTQTKKGAFWGTGKG